MEVIFGSYYPGQVVPIRYHVWWPNPNDNAYLHNPTQNTARTNEYGVSAVAAFRHDGAFIDDSHIVTYEEYYIWHRAVIDSLLNIPAPLTIEIQDIRTDDSVYVVADITAESAITGSPVVFLTIAETWSRLGMAPKHHWIMKGIYPNATGQPISLPSAGSTEHLEWVIPIHPDWKEGRLMAIVHVRDSATLEVHNAEVEEVPLYTVDVPEGQTPLRVVLDRNVPNPFNPTTTIRYQLDRGADVRLSIFSPSGRLVNNLVNGPVAGGSHEVTWNGTDQSGSQVGSGIYYYQLDTEETSVRHKMVLIR